MTSKQFCGFCEDGSSDKDTPSMLKAHCVSGTVLNTRNTKGSRTVLLVYDFAEVSTVLLSGPAFTNLSMVINGLKFFQEGILKTCSPLKVKVDQLA